jgi:hypothetical protein
MEHENEVVKIVKPSLDRLRGIGAVFIGVTEIGNAVDRLACEREDSGHV